MGKPRLLPYLLPRLLHPQQHVPLLISWPGAGVLVYWQLGVLQGLQEKFNLSEVPMLGSSSGALVCALGKGGARLDTAIHRGIELLDEYGVMQRRFGAIGILGKLTRQWLEESLPPQAAERCSGAAATLLVTTLPFLQTRPVTDFTSVTDLTSVVLASSHIPVVVDWRMWRTCRSRPCWDGGIWWFLQRSLAEYSPAYARHRLLITPYNDPNVVKDLDLLKQMRPQDLSIARVLVDMGKAYSERLVAENWDKLSHLPPGPTPPHLPPGSAPILSPWNTTLVK
mmetsp:Transcript_2183/g.3583  ORF Transcript_2183/g.3583 Transcript_2183/m.3583 type:complete len:282 (-) Transcript_2183:728-1573(-)